MALLSALFVVAALVGAWSFGLFGGRQGGQGSQAANGRAGQEAGKPKSIAVEAKTVGKVGSGSGGEAASVEVKTGLQKYSWAEIKAIAEEIEACASSEEALELARNYNLIDSSGNVRSDTKEVGLSDGTTMHMRVVGVWHDKADTASGRAGLTFLSDGIVMRHSLDGAGTIDGGWEASGMRSWLAGDVWGMMPAEVSSLIVPAYKLTNNVGNTRTLDCISETKDLLWIPSIVELSGPVDWEYQSNPANNGLYNSIFNAEGSQYLAFAQKSIISYSSNSVLSLGQDWWLRSTSPATGRGRYVSSDGDPSCYIEANLEKGVVVGFCL
ncbi:MAG: DUF6273 domain-containing protein [Coriobacteriales bacterium]|nr:DUF6273 domain-containing protein [Coriobacteriales bacterium]